MALLYILRYSDVAASTACKMYEKSANLFKLLSLIYFREIEMFLIYICLLVTPEKNLKGRFAGTDMTFCFYLI